MTATRALEAICLHFEAKNGPMTINAQNELALYKMAAWVAREPRQDMDIRKGIMLVGNVGTGKTELMRAASMAFRDFHGIGFGVKPCADLVREYQPKEGGPEVLAKWINGPHVCFDDLGTEAHEVQHMGNRSNVMAEVIEARYARYGLGKDCISHFTTNLGPGELANRYGARAASRLRHMVNLVDLGASATSIDFRATAPAPAMPEPASDAPNLYLADIHPNVIAAMKSAVSESRRLEVVREPLSTIHSLESHLEQIAELAKAMSREELLEFREKVLTENDAATSAPYLKVLDAAISAAA